MYTYIVRRWGNSADPWGREGGVALPTRVCFARLWVSGKRSSLFDVSEQEDGGVLLFAK